MRSMLLALIAAAALHAVAQPDADAPAEEAPAQPAPLDDVWKAKTTKFCESITKCNKARAGKTAYCVKTGLKESGILSRILEGEQAKDLPRYFRRAGFVDIELSTKSVEALPEGSILVLDAHDTIKDGRTLCPKVYGNVLVKCDNKWVDEQKNDLKFHFRRGCRTKGIWVPSELVPPPPKENEPAKKTTP